ncbi:hypothetical protein GMOD_00002055 [Pyrenophora seminiperda CCB06]|uniref:Uncharacterized protein n=1 Tax=Pyrenophora seminiperda CCB06 TaxID=1302712 RepID=A0A3M7LWU0_9PLEO|nr:hypothetical protein GMOD_00002055 [Pyrenophora seminiperda CCB06]
METVRKGHIDIDTRPCPTVSVSFYKTVSEESSNASADDLFESMIAFEKGSYMRTITSNVNRATPSIAADSFHTTYPSTSTSPVFSTTTGKATPQPTLAAGEVFAIVLSSLTALVIPIILLIQCLKRSRQRKRGMKKDKATLRDVMSEGAWEAGLNRSQEASTGL